MQAIQGVQDKQRLFFWGISKNKIASVAIHCGVSSNTLLIIGVSFGRCMVYRVANTNTKEQIISLKSEKSTVCLELLQRQLAVFYQLLLLTQIREEFPPDG